MTCLLLAPYRLPMFEIPLKSSQARGSFIVDLFSDTHILSLIILNLQCVGVDKEVNNKRA